MKVLLKLIFRGRKKSFPFSLNLDIEDVSETKSTISNGKKYLKKKKTQIWIEEWPGEMPRLVCFIILFENKTLIKHIY